MQDTPSYGIQFPFDANGGRSSSRVAAHIVGSALQAVDPGLTKVLVPGKGWRRDYPDHIRRLVRETLSDPVLALDSARAGLDAAWKTLHWSDTDGSRTLDSAWGALKPAPLQTVRLGGRGHERPRPCQIPYRGALLDGDALRRQADAWVERHIIEPSAAEALHRCATHPEWFDLSDRRLVLLGAGAEVGPFNQLVYWGANIIAVDRVLPRLWLRIYANVTSGNATLAAPLDGTRSGDVATDLAAAGVDLLTDAPRIAEWLAQMDGPLDLLSLAYADGERHLRLSLAMDWIARTVLDAHPDSTASWLATPTDVFAMPGRTARASMSRYEGRGILPRLLRPTLGLATPSFHPNIDALHPGPEGGEYALADSLVLQQGPNYALAKRLQQWRAVEARARGRRVSLNIAPATTTASVTSNPILAAAYAGAHHFGIEAFAPETTRALMAALWVHDLRSDDSAANPSRALAHPWDLFTDNACHGGFWACPYLPRTALPYAAAIGFIAGRGR